MILKTGRACVISALASMLLGGLLTVAPQPASAAAPARNDSFNETVYLVKGYTRAGCGSRWRTAMRAMFTWGWQGKFVRAGFYGSDNQPKKDCDINLDKDGTEQTRLKDLGKALAWNIYNDYSSKGKSVDLVGHSMGGLIVRAAVAGYQRREPGWPPVLHVEDAVTLGTPHQGTNDIVLPCAGAPRVPCGNPPHACNSQQCKDMRPGSDFLRWLGRTPNPQAAGGTDWTLIGSTNDRIVDNVESATPGWADHLVRYTAWATDLDGGHSALRYTTRGRYWQEYRNRGDRWRFSRVGAAPIRAVQNALYWSRKW